jgi:uncharacterized protein (DUF2252 family)
MSSLFAAWRDPAELVAEGVARRKAAPVEEITHYEPAADRADPLKLIEATNEDRVSDLVPLRYQRMTETPFTFLRGAATVMAHDIANGPSTGINGHVCGDAHASNFGFYASPERRLIMDVNDFDETVVGPWEWDLKRLVASLVVAARSSGLDEDAGRKAARDCAAGYRAALAELSTMSLFEGHHMTTSHETLENIDFKDLSETFERVRKKSKKNTNRRAAERFTARPTVDHWHFTPDPPVLTPVTEQERADVLEALDGYGHTIHDELRWLLSRYGVCDVAHRVVGLGSVGLRSYVVLLKGNGDEALILQVKQARPSALRSFVDPGDQERHEGQRVVEGQRWMQTVSDPLLGWATVDGRPYLVRQFRDMKGSIDPSLLRASQLDDYARVVGVVLARAHAQSIDPRLLHGYCDAGDPAAGKAFDKAFGQFAVAYGDQTTADHAVFVRQHGAAA